MESSSLWRNADFRKLWAGQTISELGSVVTRTAVPLVALLVLGAGPFQMALIVVAALKLGKDVFRPSRELIFAVIAFALALFLRLNPALILLAGGALGALVLQKAEEQNDTKKKGSEK